MFTVDKISKSFIPDVKVIDNISFKVKKGELVSLLGGNGSGKSTLLKILSGIYPCDSGSFFINNNNLTGQPAFKIAKSIHYLHQSREDNLPSSMTLLEEIMLSLTNNSNYFRFLNSGIWRKNAIEILQTLGLNLEDRLDQKIKDFSGGECQIISLVLLTELIKQNPFTESILLLDEHTAHLDANMAVKVMDITVKLVKENQITTIMVTHNFDTSIHYSDRIFILKNGKLLPEINLKNSAGQISRDYLQNLVFK